MVLANFEPEATTAGACRTARLSAAESGADVRRYRYEKLPYCLSRPQLRPLLSAQGSMAFFGDF